MKTRKLELTVNNPNECRFVSDPFNNSISHIECFLSFREINKLKRGNANVRPPDDKRKPFKAMMTTIEEAPRLFHIKNRGITYICNKLSYDEKAGKLSIEIPDVASIKEIGDNVPRYGIADGGHTFEAITRTVNEEKDYEAINDWAMPCARVHFVTGERNDEIESIVEALNTSLQVQQYTLDEYKNKFDVLKKALDAGGFDTDLVAFREGEDKEWHVIEIVQRLACFLKDRWVGSQPAGMYKSKGKALKLFTDDDTRGEFRELFPVIKDIITLPEYIQSKFSDGELLQGRKLGKLKVVKAMRKAWERPGTGYQTMYRINMAALLPIAAGFRELLVKRGDHFEWKIPVQQVFEHCAVDLYDLLANKSSKVRTASELSSDIGYWSGCQTIVMRAKEEISENIPPKTVVRKKAKEPEVVPIEQEEAHDEEVDAAVSEE